MWLWFPRISDTIGLALDSMSRKLRIIYLFFGLRSLPITKSVRFVHEIENGVLEKQFINRCKDKPIKQHERYTDEIFMDAPHYDNRFKLICSSCVDVPHTHSTKHHHCRAHQINSTDFWLVTIAFSFQLNSLWLNQRNIHPLTARIQTGETTQTHTEFEYERAFDSWISNEPWSIDTPRHRNYCLSRKWRYLQRKIIHSLWKSSRAVYRERAGKKNTTELVLR